jgi:hypothetical protein
MVFLSVNNLDRFTIAKPSAAVTFLSMKLGMVFAA